jgi:starvation-inducible outer membrane lipoprotein
MRRVTAREEDVMTRLARFIPLLAAASVLLMLSACATSPRPLSQVADTGKVTAVDQWAETKHATVVWVHTPRTAPPATPRD